MHDGVKIFTFGPKAGATLRSLTFDGFNGTAVWYLWFDIGSLGKREAETINFVGDCLWMR